jgi:hypothetical protein
MKKIILVSILFISTSLFGLSTSVSNSEEIKVEGINALKRCTQLYLQLKNFSVDVEYGVFYNKTQFNTPDEVEKGKIVRSNQSFYQEQFGQITLLNSKYQVLINKDAAVLSVGPRGDYDQIPTQFEMDSLFTKIQRVVKIEGGYQFFLVDQVIEKYDVLFSAGGYLNKMRTYYKERVDFGEGPVKIVSQISYLNFTKNPKISPDLFSEKRYVQIDKNGMVSAISAYKSFYVINNLGTN